MADVAQKEQRKGRGQNPNSKKNLKKFEPGVSGNPNGKPPGTRDRATTLKKWAFVPIDIVNPLTKEKETGTIDDEVHLAWLRECRKGNMTAVKEYLDTLHGKIVDKSEVDLNVKKIEVEFIDSE